MIESILGNSITNGGVLSDIARRLFGEKFKGLYVIGDRLPVLKEGESIILNQPSDVHWVGLVRVNGQTYKYDSFNRKSFIGGYVNGDYDNKPDQKQWEANCGQRTLAWLTTVLSNKHLL
jgi:hypothetical protein